MVTDWYGNMWLDIEHCEIHHLRTFCSCLICGRKLKVALKFQSAIVREMLVNCRFHLTLAEAASVRIHDAFYLTVNYAPNFLNNEMINKSKVQYSVQNYFKEQPAWFHSAICMKHTLRLLSICRLISLHRPRVSAANLGFSLHNR